MIRFAICSRLTVESDVEFAWREIQNHVPGTLEKTVPAKQNGEKLENIKKLVADTSKETNGHSRVH